MKHRKFQQRLDELVAELTHAQARKLIAALQQRGEGDEVQRQLEQRAGDNPQCPHCQSRRIEGWGRERSGLKRSRCRDCQRTFNPLTGTVLARLRKKERWLSFASALKGELPVRKAAAMCQVNKD
jgi:transposase-like protein